MDAQAITRKLSGTWRNGSGQSPCPACQPERRKDQTALSISQVNGKILLHCFKDGCNFVEITNAIDLPLRSARIDHAAQRESDAKQAAYAAHKLRKARDLWEHALPIDNTKAATYLRGRGISCPLPETLRFIPAIHHGPSMSWCMAMVANVSTGGVHRTFFDKQGNRLTKNAKLMLGPCAGGAVALSSGAGPLVVCEGMETGLALLSDLLSGPATVWSALSTSGIRGLALPPDPHKLTIATDGDAAGKEAGDALAMRATALGWHVSLLPAPEGKDWADILQMKAVA